MITATQPRSIKDPFYLVVSATIIVMVARPYFYDVSYAIARLSDLVGILCVFGSILYLSNNNVPMIMPRWMIYWFLAYSSVIILSIYVSSYYYQVIAEDFADVIRPAMYLISFIFGAAVAYRETSAIRLLNCIIVICLVSAAIGILEYLLTSKFPLPWLIWASKNAREGFGVGRPTGLFLHFSEFALASIFSSILSFIMYVHTKKVRYIVFSAILFCSISISSSRVAFITAALFISFLFIFGYFKITKVYVQIIIAILLAAGLYGVVLWVNYGTDVTAITFRFVIENYDKFSLNYLALIKNNTFSARAKDILTLLNTMRELDYNFFIGNGPLRQYPDLSYIEIGSIKTFYRYGLFGIVLYYLFFLAPVTWEKRGLFGYGIKYLIMFSVALLLSDSFSSVLEFPKFGMLMATVYGALWRLDKDHYQGRI